MRGIQHYQQRTIQGHHTDLETFWQFIQVGVIETIRMARTHTARAAT